MRTSGLIRAKDKNCTCLARVNAGEFVFFRMPIEGINTGKLLGIDGSYIMISVTLPTGEVIEIERLENEVFKNG